jgi:hypothetical protein
MGYFSTAGAVPANLPVGRDLTIRRKIENAGIIVLLAVRKPMIESGNHVALNPRTPNCISALPAARLIAGDDLERLHWLEIVD